MSQCRDHEYPQERRSSTRNADLSPSTAEAPPRRRSVEEVYIEHHQRVAAPAAPFHHRTHSAAYYDDGMERGRSVSSRGGDRRHSAFYGDELEAGRSMSQRGGERRPSAFHDEDRPSRTNSVSSSRRGSAQPIARQSIVADPLARKPSTASTQSSESDEDGYSSADEARKAKKLRNKELLLAAFATATTVATAGGIYHSRKAQVERRERSHERRMSPEEAKKLKNKGLAMDVLSYGISALGVASSAQCWKQTKALHEGRAAEKENAQMRREMWERKQRVEGRLLEERRRESVPAQGMWEAQAAEGRRGSEPAVGWNQAYLKEGGAWGR